MASKLRQLESLAGSMVEVPRTLEGGDARVGALAGHVPSPPPSPPNHGCRDAWDPDAAHIRRGGLVRRLSQQSMCRRE